MLHRLYVTCYNCWWLASWHVNYPTSSLCLRLSLYCSILNQRIKLILVIFDSICLPPRQTLRPLSTACSSSTLDDSANPKLENIMEILLVSFMTVSMDTSQRIIFNHPLHHIISTKCGSVVSFLFPKQQCGSDDTMCGALQLKHQSCDALSGLAGRIPHRFLLCAWGEKD